MRQVGLRFEILVTIIFLIAVSMLLIGVVAFQVTERFAIQGKIEGVKAVIAAFEGMYVRGFSVKEGIGFLQATLEEGAWGVIADSKGKVVFGFDSEYRDRSINDPLILEALKTGKTLVHLEGINLPPLYFYSGFKVASVLRKNGERKGVILIYQPLLSLKESVVWSQRLIAAWIVLDLLVIALFGYYLLSRRVVRPVLDLVKVTEEISKGRFPEDLNPGEVREIRELHMALRRMHEEIEKSKADIKESLFMLEKTNRLLLRTQKELVVSEKLASIGRLAAGIAHEIGNPLSAIKGYVDILRRGYALDEDKKKEFLINIQKEIERIDKIIRMLLNYARPTGFELCDVDVNEVVKSALEILSNQGVFKSIRISVCLSQESLWARVDSSQLVQVVINLLLNARDAVGSGGVISLSTGIASNGDIEIRVQDNGPGIPEGIMDKIFDPFFTTKEPGKGTGLGLFVSQRIVESFGGRILVESESGKGTTFKVLLPFGGYCNEQGVTA